MRLHPIVVALFVTFLGRQASALELGLPQGNLWLGSPLALRIPLVLDNAQATGSLCTQVELRQGDPTQAGTAVQALLEPGPTPERPFLSIRSTRAIEEPVLHLRVQLGCQGSTSRQFTLLADPPAVRAPVVAAPGSATTPSDSNVPAAGRAFAPAVRATPSPARAGSGRSAGSTAPAGERAAAAEGARERAVQGSNRNGATSAPRARPAPAPRATTARSSAPAARAGATAPQSRLQLDSLEPLPQELPLRAARRLETPLRAGTGSALLTGPAPGVPQGEAGVASGQAAPAAAPTPEQIERNRELEAALAELRAQANQSKKTVAQLQGELNEARERRNSNPLLYVLGLLLLALIALWILRRRSDDDEPREGGSPFSSSPSGLAPLAPRAGLAPAPSTLRERLGRRRSRARAEADEDETGDSPRFFGAAAAGHAGADDEDGDDRDPPRHGAGASGFGNSMHGHAQDEVDEERAHDVDELHDVQQQAEFFSSLGEHERAVEALRHYVDAHPQASAMAYLELLHLYHQLQRTDDYEALRQRCQQALNVRLPDFRGFGAVGGRRLQDYPWALERLQSHWPSSQTLDVIEELLFRSGAAEGDEPFDLAAYRELLMLHALVQEQHFSDGQPWPALEELLRLPGHEEQAGAAPSTQATLRASLQQEPSGLDASLFVPEHFAQMLAQEHDRSPAAELPPLDMELDMDLSRLEAQQIDTIPLSLRRPHEPAPAPESDPGVPTMPLPLSEPLRLVPRADETPPAPSRSRSDKSGGGSSGGPQAARRLP